MGGRCVHRQHISLQIRQTRLYAGPRATVLTCAVWQAPMLQRLHFHYCSPVGTGQACAMFLKGERQPSSLPFSVPGSIPSEGHPYHTQSAGWIPKVRLLLSVNSCFPVTQVNRRHKHSQSQDTTLLKVHPHEYSPADVNRDLGTTPRFSPRSAEDMTRQTQNWSPRTPEV